MEDSKAKYIIKSAIGVTLFVGLTWVLLMPTFKPSRFWNHVLRCLWYLPIWLIVGVVYGAVTWKGNIDNIKENRQEQGLCTKCGYDIRRSGVDTCPECGTPNVPT
ncbi:MAG: hypothetical protein DHS20C16_00400 [Phycisphaerae bacterium]|nr:MAG: hypothetical protein DHS20C16_00400 [Phycisphaerae bacterium]